MRNEGHGCSGQGRGRGRDAEEAVTRVPLRVVVADCVRRFFESTLKAAESGDSSMQMLVGEMYCCGYGVPRNMVEGRYWLKKAGMTVSEARMILSSLSDE